MDFEELEWVWSRTQKELAIKVDTLYICCMRNVSWLFGYSWSVSVRNSLGSLGEIFGVALQWSGRNSMAPVSGCPWWCPIYMVW